jgi:hypothetical protein
MDGFGNNLVTIAMERRTTLCGADISTRCDNGTVTVGPRHRSWVL